MRLIALSLLLFVAAAAKEVVIYAEALEANQSRIELQRNFAVEYDNYHLEGYNARYDHNQSVIRLHGRIELLEEGVSAAGERGEIWLKERRFRLNNFFFSESNSSLWAKGERVEANESRVSLVGAFLSSCDVECSDWKFYFGSGELDRIDHWVNLYNIALYAKDVPIFYFPYIGFSTLKRRHSGLLRPTVGLSDKEGIVYIQPFYYAPMNWWDLELDPQIRTNRGQGLYGTFRFVDSPTSFGQLRAGYFREKSSYRIDNDIKNPKHYGLEAYYRRRKVFSGNESDDGVYLDAKSYNDVDYFYLQKHSSLTNISSIIISRLNYFFEKDRDYFGLYAKYFKDNRKVSNDDTLQILPTLHYHRYLKSIFKDRISYSVDAQISHYYRETGLNAIEYRFDLPIRFYTSFWEDRIGFSISENLNARYADYNFVEKRLNKKWKNYHVYRNSHQISLFSDLVRAYPEFFHTLHLDATLNIPSFEKEGGDRAPFIDVTSNEKQLWLSLKQYFFDLDGQEFFYHRLVQPFVYDYPHKAKELENEFGFRWRNLDLNFDTFYSHQRGKLVGLITQVRYEDERNDLYLSHFYKDRLTGQRDSNYLRLDLKRTLSKKYELFATIDYDFVGDRTKSWSVGWQMRSKCWMYMISYKNDVVPILTSAGSNSYNNNIVYFRIELYPLGGISRSISKSYEQRTF